jgi:hypothetical protein
VTVAVNYYLEVLLQLQQEYEWTIYVHPVAPVLNETRSTVKLFNAILREKVKCSPTLRLLDFFQHLLGPDGGFNKQYELDGTHMSPAYLPLIEEAVSSMA